MFLKLSEMKHPTSCYGVSKPQQVRSCSYDAAPRARTRRTATSPPRSASVAGERPQTGCALSHVTRAPLAAGACARCHSACGAAATIQRASYGGRCITVRRASRSGRGATPSAGSWHCARTYFCCPKVGLIASNAWKLESTF
jgi:hypothetical protein